MIDDELPPDVHALIGEARDRERAEIADAGAALSRRVLDDFDAVMARRTSTIGARLRASLQRLSETAWPGAPVWKPAVALGLSLAIGLGVGAFLPLGNSPDETAASSDAAPGVDLGVDVQ